MKYKKLTKEQIIISLDRLTRFKNTKEKYKRVFTDILISNLIEPKLRKNEIMELDTKTLLLYIEEIFNSSISNNIYNNVINITLRDYENSVFINDESTQILLNNNINYYGALDLIPEDAPVNLRWLKSLVKNEEHARENHLLKFPIEEVILVEGITEEILLPAFSKFLGFDFYAKGIQIIASGGKNQVVKMYYELSEQLKLPIFVLLDKDAEENIQQIQPKLRPTDRIHLVSCGEFEDLLPKSLIVKTVNSHFRNFLSITENDLPSDRPTAKVLEEIFKTKGLHEFKKAEFAKLVRNEISESSDISDEIHDIIKEISSANKSLYTKVDTILSSRAERRIP